MVPDNNGGVFVVSRSHLYHVTEGAKDGGDFWSGGWDPRGICSDGRDGVFILSGTRLYHVTPDAKKGSFITDGWTDTFYVPYVLDRDGFDGVFIARATDLYRVFEDKTWTSQRLTGSSFGSLIDDVTYDGIDGVFITDTSVLAHVDPHLDIPKRENWADGLDPVGTATDGKGGVFMLQVDGSLTHFSPSHKEGFYWSNGWDVPSNLDIEHRLGLESDGDDGVFLLSKDSLFHVYPDKTAGDFWSSGWATNAIFVVGQ